MFAAATAAVAAAGNAAVCAGLNRFTNLTPSMQGAISAGVISGVGAAGLVAGKWAQDNFKEPVFVIYVLALPLILTWALAPQVSRVLPEAKVTIWQGAGYAVIGNIAYIAVISIFPENTIQNLSGGLETN